MGEPMDTRTVRALELSPPLWVGEFETQTGSRLPVLLQKSQCAIKDLLLSLDNFDRLLLYYCYILGGGFANHGVAKYGVANMCV